MSRYIGDLSTGEVLTLLDDGDRVLRQNSINKITNTTRINEGRGYVKVFADSINMLIQDNISHTELKVLFAVMPYIRYETGLISHGNGEYISMKSLVELCDMSQRTVYGAIEKLVRKRVLAKVRTGREIKFYANPYIFMRGTHVNKTLDSMFRMSKYNK